ncbi:MAG: lysophospholipid acyltransferase family protein [Bacteroidales bacterium]|nr:lysophospholipid acyltransferase family protein [Bacteroidales bacterium]
MGAIFFFLLYLLAWLPLPVLYLMSDLLWPVAYYLLRYRRKMTRKNLLHSFPEKSETERKKIERKYYRHMCDLVVEAIWNLRATPRQILRHYQVKNRELVDKYYEKGQSVVLMSAHYNNWEFMVTSLNMQFRHHGIGVGKPLDDRCFGAFLTKKRTRFGTEVVDQTNVRPTMKYYNDHHVPCAYMMLSDQSPSNPNKCYWTTFLGQDTGFLFGAERFARKYCYPVLFYNVWKVRRGYYELIFQEISSQPETLPEGKITERYVRWLEETINHAPAYWLWSHRRWKMSKSVQAN